MYALAAELASRRSPVVTTTTTRIYPPSPHESPTLLLQSDEPLLESLPGLLKDYGHVTVARSLTPETGKLEGVSESIVELCSTHARFVLVEADGAAGRSIKAPETWEPVIPRCADLVIPVVGLDCLGHPATADRVFRLDRFRAVTGVSEGEIIGPEAVARLLTHPEGGLKGVPVGASVIPFLNAKDDALDRLVIAEIAAAVNRMAAGRISRIVAGRTDRVIAASLPSPED